MMRQSPHISSIPTWYAPIGFRSISAPTSTWGGRLGSSGSLSDMLFYLLSLAGLAPIIVGIEPAVAPVPRACTTRSGTRLRSKRVISSRTDGSLASPARARRSSACSGCRAPDSSSYRQNRSSVGHRVPAEKPSAHRAACLFHEETEGTSPVSDARVKRLRLSLALEDVRTDGAGQDLAKLDPHEGACRVAGHAGVERFFERTDHLGVGIRDLLVEPEGVVVHDPRHPPADLTAERRDGLPDRGHVLKPPDMEPLEVEEQDV